MQTLARKMAEVFCGTPLPPPNREVKLLIVMHGFRKKKATSCGWDERRCVLTGVNTVETPICDSHSSVISRLFLFSPFLLYLGYFIFSHPPFFNSSRSFPKSLWSWGFPVIDWNYRTKVGCSTPVLRGRTKLFWEGCLPTAWMADLKGWRGGGGETTSGAQGWERTHCGGFYGVELIFM